MDESGNASEPIEDTLEDGAAIKDSSTPLAPAPAALPVFGADIEGARQSLPVRRKRKRQDPDDDGGTDQKGRSIDTFRHR